MKSARAMADSAVRVDYDFTRSRVERIISFVGGVCIAFFTGQALLRFFVSYPNSSDANLWLAALIFGAVTVLVIAGIIGRYVKTAAIFFCISYLIGVLFWPLTGISFVPSSSELPWLWMMVNVASFAGLLFLPLLWQLIWLIFIPMCYGAVLLWMTGPDQSALPWISLDVSFALIFGMVLFALAWMFRTMAQRVDVLRTEAVLVTARVAAEDAAESERVEIAALMHDSVLAALIAGAKAETPRQEELAKQMATEALIRLADADNQSLQGSENPVALALLRLGLEDSLNVVPPHAHARLDLEWVRPNGTRLRDDEKAGLFHELELPERVVRALTLASRQAILNSVEHAEAVGLRVSLQSTVSERSLRSILIRISDNGPGFDPSQIPLHRLGVRGSIEARMRAVSGSATLQSDDSGTMVELLWSQK